MISSACEFDIHICIRTSACYHQHVSSTDTSACYHLVSSTDTSACYHQHVSSTETLACCHQHVSSTDTSACYHQHVSSTGTSACEHQAEARSPGQILNVEPKRPFRMRLHGKHFSTNRSPNRVLTTSFSLTTLESASKTHSERLVANGWTVNLNLVQP